MSFFFYERFDEKQQAVYHAFSSASENLFSSDPFVFSSGKEENEESRLTITHAEADVIYQGFRYDHPERFWLANSYEYRRLRNENGEYDENRVDAVSISMPFHSEEDWKQARRLFSERTEKVFEQIDSVLEEQSIKKSDTAFEAAVVRAVHDYLLEEVSYEENATYDPLLWKAHTAYGALVEGRAVCDGYALAFRYLLSAYGIDCILIPGEFSGAAHVWTMVWYDGGWHEFDPTMDDVEEEGAKYRYFDLTTEEMNKDHTRETGGIALLLPVASS